MTVSGQQLMTLVASIGPPVTRDGLDGEVFATLQIPHAGGHLLGRDAAGLVALLITIDTSCPLGPLPPVRLENLSVTHACRCIVSQADQATIPGIFTVVRCLSDDRQVIELFIQVLTSVLEQFAKPPSVQVAAQLIDRVVRLFRDLGKPSERSVQGLWAEMFVIANSSDPICLAHSWRSTSFDCSDFSTERERLEVKSTVGTIRTHVFNADQLITPTGIKGVVASVLCRRAAGGVSVGELWSMIRRQLATQPSVVLRLDGLVVETLGESWKQSLELRYDWQVAQQSLRFFSMESIPNVGPSLPSQISDVRFRADLSGISALTREQMAEMGGLMAAVVPTNTPKGVHGVP